MEKIRNGRKQYTKRQKKKKEYLLRKESGKGTL